MTKLEHNHGQATALIVLAHKLARAVSYMLTRYQAFDLQRFVAAYPLRGEIGPVVELADGGESLGAAPSRGSPDGGGAAG